MDLTTEIRKISPGYLFTLVQILELDESWKRLMAIIPKTLTLDNFECKIAYNNLPKYNTDHFKLIENAGNQQKRPCSEILFEEWGTSGRIRPRLGHLLRLLEKAQLYRAADYVAVELLKAPAPERPETGPAAKIDVNLSDSISTDSNSDIERLLDQINYPSSILNHSSSISSNSNDVNQNLEPPKRIIPKIVINSQLEDNSTSQNISENSFEVSLNQLEQKIERLRYSPQICEESTKSTTLNSLNSNEGSDMIQFSSSGSPIPAISSLMNYESSNSGSFCQVLHETRNYNLPQLSELIQHEVSGNLPDIPAFSQILESESNVPAFSQILENERDEFLPAFLENISQLQQSQDLQDVETPVDVPHISVLLEDSSQNSLVSSNLIRQQTSEMLTVRKMSSPVNTSSRSCVSPLPNLSLNTVLPHFTYLELEQCTNNFNEGILRNSFLDCEPIERKLGSGAFGSVYLGIGLLEKPIAVKKLNLNNVNVVNVDDTVTKQFRNEVELLCKYKHDNLLSLLGYSCDGSTYCLVYEYISGGALKDRLQSTENRLMWTNRLYIALGTAKAVWYLHTAYSTPLIHRDIKSANILLDNADKPKLCDFGLIKLSPNQNTNTSTTVFGTSAYMAPEAFRGDVSVKLDTFSFGVVLLELLTGLPPLDENREGNDLVTHVEDVCENDIKPLLDHRAGSWMHHDTNFGEHLYEIALQCLEEKKRRLFMVEVVKKLSQLIDKTNWI